MRLILDSTLTLLEKSHALPVGTRRKYGNQWRKKIADGSWVYDGMVDAKHSVPAKNVGTRSTIRKRVETVSQLFSGLTSFSTEQYEELKQRWTVRNRMGYGQEVKYTGSFHTKYRGKIGKLVAIGERGYAMVQFGRSKPVTALWSDLRVHGAIKSHSLYDNLDPKNVYHVDGEVKQRLDAVMNQQIGNSGMSYNDLCMRFKQKGFNLQVVGGTVRDILSGKKDVNDIDFIFNGTDRELKYVVGSINQRWIRNAVTNPHIGLVSFKDGKDVVDITPVHKYSPEMQDMAKGWNLQEDAESRDLAMNSLQLDSLTNILVDASGKGLKDIHKHTINVMKEDYLKVNPRFLLRIFKFLGRGYKPSVAMEGAL